MKKQKQNKTRQLTEQEQYYKRKNDRRKWWGEFFNFIFCYVGPAILIALAILAILVSIVSGFYVYAMSKGYVRNLVTERDMQEYVRERVKSEIQWQTFKDAPAIELPKKPVIWQINTNWPIIYTNYPIIGYTNEAYKTWIITNWNGSIIYN